MIASEYKHITIVGGGMVGLSMAASFADVLNKNPSFKICLIEEKDFQEKNAKKSDGRVSAIAKGSEEILRLYGIFDEEIERQSCKIDKILVTDESAKNITQNPYFFSTFFDTKEMGYMVENNILLNKMLKTVKNNKNILLKEKVKVQDVVNEGNFVKLKLDSGQIIKSKLLLACDGRNSEIAKKIKIERVGEQYQQTALVFILEHENFHKNIAVEKFLKNGPFAILPMFGGKKSAIVWTEKREVAKILLGLDKKDFRDVVLEKYGNIFGEGKIASDVMSYPLSLSYVREYHKGRICLVGDAAHAIHPIAGQGFNLSLRDISYLSELIKEQLKLGLDFSSPSVLEKYQKKRKADISLMIKSTDTLNKLFASQNPFIKIVRRHGLKIFDRFDFIKKMTTKYAMGKSSIS